MHKCICLHIFELTFYTNVHRFCFYCTDLEWRCLHENEHFQLRVNGKLIQGWLWRARSRAIRLSSTYPEQETMFGTSRVGRKLHLSNNVQFRDLRVAWITGYGWAVLCAHSWGISSIGTFQVWTDWNHWQFVIFSFWLTCIPLSPPKKIQKHKDYICIEAQMIENTHHISPFWTTSNKQSFSGVFCLAQRPGCW